MVYIYESCCGSLYTSRCLIKDTYCSQCGDYDTYWGKAKCKKDVYKLFEGAIDIDGSGGWDENYFEEFVNGIAFI